MSEKEFRKLAEPLRRFALNALKSKETNFPFVIVVKRQLVSSEFAMQNIVARGQEGIVKMYPKTPNDFQEIQDTELPNTSLYLIGDIDTGREFLSISPEDSLKTIYSQKRTPLTLDEGVALATHYPEILTDRKIYNCIQMPGSRIANDQRVPSIWISEKKPRLGWCWDRNIHTWLGSASASKRLS